MSTATALKFQNEAKQLASKLLQERKKAILVLILRHLADSGYTDAYKKLEGEASLSLGQASSQVTLVCASLKLRQLLRRFCY